MNEFFEFVTNNHNDTILKSISNSEEIIIGVGFLKDSGFSNIEKILKQFLSKENSKSTFFIGLGFGETSPSALKNLSSLIKPYKNHKLILCIPDAGIFHPKLYLFKSQDKIEILTGSANLTEAGWNVNDEVSVKIKTTVFSKGYKEISKYFANLKTKYEVEDVDDLINKYEAQLKEFNKRKNQQIKFIFNNNDLNIDMPRLIRYYELYKKSNQFRNPDINNLRYEQAKLNLDLIVQSSHLSDNDFIDLFGPLVGFKGYDKLWNSGGIHRRSKNTVQYKYAFKEIIQLIKLNLKNPLNIAFTDIIRFLNEKRNRTEIFGIGKNIIAEMLMSYNPNKFANLNKNPIQVLNLIGKTYPSYNSFNGEIYLDYVSTLSQIKTTLNMNSFIEIDSFFNYVYWNLMEG